LLLHAEVDFWDEDDVAQWLEGIGMPEYIQTFIQHNVVGSRLQQLKKSDLLVSGEVWVGLYYMGQG
jgi:hypothetical protein